MDVQGSVATYPKEVEALPEMLDRIEEKHAIKPDYLISDTAYGKADCIHEIADIRGIEPHIPVWDKSKRKDGTLSNEAFIYDMKDAYLPSRPAATSDGRVNDDNCERYQ